VSFVPGSAVIVEKAEPAVIVCAPAVPVKTAHDDVVSQATYSVELGDPPGRFGEPVSVPQVTVDPEKVTVRTVPDAPAIMHQPAEGQDTPVKFAVTPVDSVVAAKPLPELDRSSALPPLPTAKHIEAEPQLRAEGVPLGGLDGAAIVVQVPPNEVDTCPAQDPAPPAEDTPTHVVDVSAQL